MAAHLLIRPRGPPGKPERDTSWLNITTGTPGANEGARSETSSAHTPGISMSTIFPRLAAAITHAGLRHAAAAAVPPAHPANGVALFAFLLAIAFLVVVVRINGAMVGLVTQLLQLAAVGFALVVAIVVGAAFVVLILHG